jgi:uncharacterized protein (DUF2164 family)
VTIELEDARRKQLLTRLQRFYENELEEELSTFRAEQLLDFFLETLGPQVYNQAVQDARGYMQGRLDDLEGEVYQPDGT